MVHTASDEIDAAKTAAPAVFNPSSLGDLTGLDVLVVDDIAGSGDTAERTAELARAAGAAKVRTAIWVVNAENWRRAQPPEQAVTYIGQRVEGWVIFPWECP
ncbi:phosphoribosyltransferase family protein [Dactylosporangium darangshiense]|uniref:phosphoribosyltransferase family protein n=1 Tax=Dactylosporangium darangshiense TaxID=579108 RepID=UPI0036372331